MIGQPADHMHCELPVRRSRGFSSAALRRIPLERYGDAAELLTDLGASTGTSPASGAAATRARPWRLLRFGSIAALLAVIAAGVLYLTALQRNRCCATNDRRPNSRESAGGPSLALVDSDTEESDLADGMTEELITQLSRIGGLRVIARSSVVGYSGGKNAPRSDGNWRCGALLRAPCTKLAARCRSRATGRRQDPGTVLDEELRGGSRISKGSSGNRVAHVAEALSVQLPDLNSTCCQGRHVQRGCLSALPERTPFPGEAERSRRETGERSISSKRSIWIRRSREPG